MADVEEIKLKLFELYVATADKISDRRAQANTWMLSVNTAVISLYGYIQVDKATVSSSQRSFWVWAIPFDGLIVCVAWLAILSSYRKLSRAKYTVIKDIEMDLPLALFAKEQQTYHADRRRSLTIVEQLIPCSFIVLYVIIFAGAILGLIAR